MFCTSLRRRPSFSHGISKLTGPENLGLRESRLTTHDLALLVNASVDARTGSTVVTRQLRVLLFSPSATNEDKLSGTLERIRHFASLSGGQNLAIIFLLEAPTDKRVEPAKDLNNDTPPYSGQEGIVAYTKLQAVMMDHADIPHIPILPLAKLGGLADLLKKHKACLSRPKQKTKPTTTVFALLQLCTASPPMAQQTAFIISDLFPSLRELAIACTSVSSAPNSSSPSTRAAGFSSQVTGTQGNAMDASMQFSDDHPTGKLKRLRDLVGERECADVVDFWKEEWTID